MFKHKLDYCLHSHWLSAGQDLTRFAKSKSMKDVSREVSRISTRAHKLHMSSLPEFDPVIEDEDHVIRTCGYYKDLRASLNRSMKGYLEEDLRTLFAKEEHSKGTAKLLVRIYPYGLNRIKR